MKFNVENENYPLNDEYLRNNPEILTLTNKLSEIQNIIYENSKVENILDNQSQISGDIVNQEDMDFFGELNNGEADLFEENNIIFNKSLKINELLNSIKKENIHNEEENEKRDQQLIVFDNFKDTQEL